MLASHVTIVHGALCVVSPFTLRVYLHSPLRRVSGYNPDLLWLGLGFMQG